MAKLIETVVLAVDNRGMVFLRNPVGDEGKFELRRPSNREWNDYEADKISQKTRKKWKSNHSQAACNLFGKVLTVVENLEDNKGMISLESKDRIWASTKARAIFLAFEDEDGSEDNEDDEDNDKGDGEDNGDLVKN